VRRGQDTRGVTTSALALTEAARRAGGSPHDLLRAICGVANGPVCVAVAAGDHAVMLREVRDWAAAADNVVATLPGSEVGIEVVRACAAERMRTGVGACASPEQALAAARAGAVTLAAPVGRVGGRDGYVDGYDVIRKLVALLRTYDLPTEVVADAIRIPTDVIDAAVAGRARRHGAGGGRAAIRRGELADRERGLTVRIRQHVNPLKSDLLDIADVPTRGGGAGQALEVELGAAEAHFLIDRARATRHRCSSASRSGASWSRR
jgi:transaldolase